MPHILPAFLFAVLCLTVRAEDKPLWLVVGKPGLVEAVEPLAAKRKAEGFRTVISTKPVAEALRDASPTTSSFLLLVGDDEPGKETEAWSLPAKRLPLYRWQEHQPRQYASDWVWGDLDGNGWPDIPVGRIPARSRQEASVVVEKILEFEGRPPSQSDLLLPVWGGAPGYGGVVDAVAGVMLVNMVGTLTPKWCQPWLMSADTRLATCGWPPDQPASFAARMREGGFLFSLMGHGSQRAFHGMYHEGTAIEFTAECAQKEMSSGPAVAPLLIYACDCGDFTDSSPCLAESLLLMRGGPVAVIAATTVSHPMPNYLSGVSFLRTVGQGEERLGKLWLRVQYQAQKSRDILAEKILLDSEGNLGTPLDLRLLKRDNLFEYAVLGDPATRLKVPRKAEIALEKTSSGWHWKAKRPSGNARIEVGLRSPTPPVAVAGQLPKEAEARKAFQAANDRFAFVPLQSPGANVPWEGTVDKEGTLRVVITGTGVFQAAAVELKKEETPQ